MSVALDFRNTNSLWASVLVETLARCGVGRVVVSPGSRSTPLTIAFARHDGFEAIPVLDERSGAFLALGLAKRSRRPVALVCTSGTAAANYLPAIIEAHESSTPLIVITADRPPEMRDCAAGQTIDQQKIYGGFVRFFHELAVPEPKVELLRYLRQTVANACRQTGEPRPGPVHLNAPFRDPLHPAPDGSVDGLRSALDEAFFEHLRSEGAPGGIITGWQRPTTARGLIVAGPVNPADAAGHADAVGRLAEGLGWPILADALSPVRHRGARGVPVVAHYDAIIRDREAAQTLLPRTVLCVGDWPTSKALRGWLGQSQAEIVMLAGMPSNRDALHGRTRHLPFPVEVMAVEGRRPADAAYLRAWQEASDAAARSLDAAFADASGMFEAKAAWLLARRLPEETPVFVASSMPVRDVEYFWPLTSGRHRFFFNRGANGIDGTLSTAVGIAHGGKPAVLLTGDLAFLHDSNGLLHAPRLRGSLTVILINNRGGGIFEHLPVAKFDPPFEEFFATPQDVDFGKLCAAHGVEHRLVRDWDEFSGLVAAPPPAGMRVLEVRTDRKADAATRRRLMSAAALAAGAAVKSV